MVRAKNKKNKKKNEIKQILFRKKEKDKQIPKISIEHAKFGYRYLFSDKKQLKLTEMQRGK